MAMAKAKAKAKEKTKHRHEQRQQGAGAMEQNLPKAALVMDALRHAQSQYTGAAFHSLAHSVLTAMSMS